MPNHVTSEIKITGPSERVAEFFNQARKTETQTDFHGNKKEVINEFNFGGFIPPPDHPDYTSGGCSHSHFEYRGDRSHLDPNPNCWYAWNVENWGTKWGSYDVKVGGSHTILDRLVADGVTTEVVKFDTAWSPPFPVFDKIVELYPDCKFVFRWLDEDSQGSGGGMATAENGEMGEVLSRINDPDDPETGKLWWSLARDLQGYTMEQHEEYLAEVAEDERLTAEAEAGGSTP